MVRIPLSICLGMDGYRFSHCLQHVTAWYLGSSKSYSYSTSIHEYVSTYTYMHTRRYTYIPVRIYKHIEVTQAAFSVGRGEAKHDGKPAIKV